MGLVASIDIKFNQTYSFDKIIEELISNHWLLNDNGKIIFLDNNDYDWKESNFVNQEIVLNGLKNRFDNNNIVALNFLYKGVTGGNFIFINNHTISINLNINRKKIDGTNHTDFSFYIFSLNEIISNCNITCSELI
jgi:hypothetical protein